MCATHCIHHCAALSKYALRDTSVHFFQFDGRHSASLLSACISTNTAGLQSTRERAMVYNSAMSDIPTSHVNDSTQQQQQSTSRRLWLHLRHYCLFAQIAKPFTPRIIQCHVMQPIARSHRTPRQDRRHRYRLCMLLVQEDA